MSDIILLSKTDIKLQNQFLFDNYPSFVHSAVHGYLFEGLNLREIEDKYLGKEQQGFFAKVVLNMVGIDTSRRSKNCGKYAGMDEKLVANKLMADGDPRINNIGRILMKN